MLIIVALNAYAEPQVVPGVSNIEYSSRYKAQTRYGIVPPPVISDDFLPPSQKAYLTELRHAADQGNAKAEAKLGDMYIDGDLVKHDVNKAVEWYQRAADHGDTYAKYMLSIFYEKGLAGLPTNLEASNVWRLRAEQARDHVKGKRLVGNRYLNYRSPMYNPEEAIKWYTLAADQGDVPSQVHLAEIYQTGFHVKKDTYAALNWLGKASMKHSAEAQYDLGVMLLSGQGGVTDPKEAFKWLHKAANHGIIPAQEIVGDLYAKGEGIARDPYEAYAWWSLAYSKVKDPDLEKKRVELFESLTPKEQKRALDRAKALKEQHKI